MISHEQTSLHKSRGPQDFPGPENQSVRAPFSDQTNWKMVMSPHWAAQRVINFTESMKPGDCAVIRGDDPCKAALSAYDLRATAQRAYRSTARAWIYFGLGFAAGVAVMLIDFLAASH